MEENCGHLIYRLKHGVPLLKLDLRVLYGLRQIANFIISAIAKNKAFA